MAYANYSALVLYQSALLVRRARASVPKQHFSLGSDLTATEHAVERNNKPTKQTNNLVHDLGKVIFGYRSTCRRPGNRKLNRTNFDEPASNRFRERRLCGVSALFAPPVRLLESKLRSGISPEQRTHGEHAPKHRSLLFSKEWTCTTTGRKATESLEETCRHASSTPSLADVIASSSTH